MSNKIKILLEIISFIFLVPRYYASQTRRIKKEGNKHFYGLWIMILREFNMEKLIWIVQKRIINLQSIFENGLVTCKINSVFKGCQLSLFNFIESAQASNKSGETCGPVHVDLEDPAADQLWDEFHGVMKAPIDWMVPFLKLFEVEEGNGLSPFSTEINTS